MTPEQILELMQTAEGRALLQQVLGKMSESDDGKAILAASYEPMRKAAIEEWETAGGGKNLREHNNTLLGEVRDLKDKLKNSDGNVRNMQKLIDIAGVKDYNELEDRVVSFKTGSGQDNDEIKELRRDLGMLKADLRERDALIEGLNSERDTLSNTVKDGDSYISRLLIDNGIKNGLLKQGFSEPQAEALVSRVGQLGKFEIEVDALTNDRRAVSSTGLDPLSFIEKDFMLSAEGKSFVPILATGSGAGGSGGRRPTGGRKPWKEMTWTEKAQLKAEVGPEEYNRLKNKQ